MSAVNILSDMVGRKLFHDQVVLGEQIGIGGCGTVYKAKDACDGKTLAVKCVSFKEMEDFQLNNLLRECRIHAALSGHHEGIIRQQSYDIDHDEGIAYITLEFCESGELFDVINANKYFERPDLIKEHFLQLLDVIEFMHSRGYYHRDIKPENILFKENDKLVIADFGFAIDKRRSSASTSRLGTVGYMAHELLNIGSWSDVDVDHAKTDIWALGMTLFSMITGDIPWEMASEELDDRYWRFRQNPQTHLKSYFDLSPAANFLFVRIFNKTSAHRPDIAAIRSSVENIKSFGSGRRKRGDGTLEPYPEPYFRPSLHLQDDTVNSSSSPLAQSFKNISNDLDDKDKVRLTPAFSTLRTTFPVGDEDNAAATPFPYIGPLPRKTKAPANGILNLGRRKVSNVEVLSLQISETSSAESSGPETPLTLADEATQADKSASIPKLILDAPETQLKLSYAGIRNQLNNFKAVMQTLEAILHSDVGEGV